VVAHIVELQPAGSGFAGQHADHEKYHKARGAPKRSASRLDRMPAHDECGAEENCYDWTELERGHEDVQIRRVVPGMILSREFVPTHRVVAPRAVGALSGAAVVRIMLELPRILIGATLRRQPISRH